MATWPTTCARITVRDRRHRDRELGLNPARFVFHGGGRAWAGEDGCIHPHARRRRDRHGVGRAPHLRPDPSIWTHAYHRKALLVAVTLPVHRAGGYARARATLPA